MILGSSGQNIYPEEIEAKLNAIAPVAESLVVDGGDGHLVALIYLDPEATADMTPDQKMEAARAVVKGVNASLAAYEQIRDIEIMDSEFEKNSQALHQAISLPQTIIYQSSYPFTAVRLYAGMAAMATTLALSAQQSADKQPNIILFLVDDMGWQETSVPFWSEKTPLNERYRTPTWSASPTAE